MPLLKRKKDEVEQIKKGLTTPQPNDEIPINMDVVVSTGSTLLDLAISGGRRRGGGIPGGILCEIFGPSGWGKTSVMSEICANAQSKGGFAMIGDAERRLSKDFINYMGMRVGPENLRYPHTVEDLEELIFDTPETGSGIIDVVGVDSIAALISTQETKTKKTKDSEGNEVEVVVGTQKDKRGSAKAKDLHSLCRRAKIEMSKKNRLVVFTNQVQIKQDEFMLPNLPAMYKEKTPGGDAILFYASLRLRVGPGGKNAHVMKIIKMGGNELKQTKGVKSNVYVFKSSIDAPYRSADIYIMFDYGIDDIRGNLEYIKEITGNKQYWAVTEEVAGIENAITHIEQNNLQEQLKEATITLWYEVDARFKFERIPKQR